MPIRETVAGIIQKPDYVALTTDSELIDDLRYSSKASKYCTTVPPLNCRTVVGNMDELAEIADVTMFLVPHSSIGMYMLS